MRERLSFLKIAGVFALSAGWLLPAQETQTYQIGPDSAKSPQAQTQKKPSQNQSQSQEQQLGWGTNIQNARIGRAAELALKKGDKGQALDFARRAVHTAPNDSQLWFLLGYAARLNGRFDESVQAYQKGLKLNPSSLDGQSGLAQDLAIMGHTADAQTMLKQIVAADPRRRDDTLLLGETYMRAKDYQGALDWLTRAERIKPEARSEILLAISYEQLKQMDVANRYLEMARHHDPNNPDVERTLAGYFRETGKYGDAINALKAIRNPRPDVVAELAYTYQLNGNMTEAAKLYARSANAMPKDMALQLSAAQAEVAVGSVEDANTFLKRAETIDANYYRLHAIRGEIARMQERDDEAANEYNTAIANLPSSPAEGPLYGVQLHVNLMQIYGSLGDKEKSNQQLQIAQTQIGALDEQGPGRNAFLRLRSLIKMAGGNLDSALADIKEAIALAPRDRDNLQQNGDILMKLGRTEDAINLYKQVLDLDHNNRFALTSLGYASRAAGRPDEAERYFKRLAQVDPNSYAPYLALGDLYTSRREFTQAQSNYTKAYALGPKHPLVVAGGMNAAIEAHNIGLAGDWYKRVTDPMLTEPQILREEERYLSFSGDYAKSEQVGQQAIKVLPTDRDVIVYLGYDLLHQEKYPELLALTTRYNSVLPKEPDLPLLAGYVHKHNGEREEAEKDFTEAIARDPNATTAYVNRGYMRNDLGQPDLAAQDFEAAVKLEPKNGEAHLGLAYADLDLNKPGAALRNADLAEKSMGDFRDVHVIRATAYGRQDMLGKAANEYRAALRFTPNDPALHLGLGNTMFSERRYHPAIDEFLIAEKSAPNDANIDAMLARSYANLDDRPNTLHYVDLAERNAASMPETKHHFGPSPLSTIYVETGQALNTIGEQNAAMQRFTKALDVPHSDRVSVRLALAETMTEQGHEEDAQRQIALALMEAGTGETTPVSGNQYIEAANVLRGMHNYDLSQAYLERARRAGAPDPAVRIGMANNYLAVGDTLRAKAELDAVRASSDGDPDYQYLLAQANVFRQEHRGAQAQTSFAQATNAEGEDTTAEQGLLETGGEEGLAITPKVSVLSDITSQPIFEDTTVYVLDAKLDAAQPISSTNTSLLPPPRSTLQTQWTAAYHLHYDFLPPISGFYQLRNARGSISVPATNSIVNRDTTDNSFNVGVNPTFRFGTSTLTLNSGIQATVRRDAQTPVQINQNLIREFTYVSSSSFFNALSFSGYVIHEHGPFTDTNLNSSLITAALDFRVGAPWGKTALVTGWGYSDQKFSPQNYENYFTSSYVGMERRFGPRINVRAMLEDIRAWRIFNSGSGIAQNLRPAGLVDFTPRKNWDIQVSSAWSSTRSFHVYDAIQNGFSVSYARPFRRRMTDAGGPITYSYPLRFSAGLQDESFYNFTGSHSQQLRPYFGITIF
ncbi:tetratricopeptide repeat protein [Acidobacteria bacterium AB60]|nr:tetratricopeptide repeat protein [Acidobacteria bacterium AB60]